MCSGRFHPNENFKTSSPPCRSRRIVICSSVSSMQLRTAAFVQKNSSSHPLRHHPQKRTEVLGRERPREPPHGFNVKAAHPCLEERSVAKSTPSDRAHL